MWHKTYEDWHRSLDGEVEEIFDTQMDVENDPCGAHWAIQHMSSEVRRLNGDILRKDSHLEAWISAFKTADHYAVAIHDDNEKYYSLRSKDFNEMYRLYRDKA